MWDQRTLPVVLSREIMQRAIQEFARMGGRARAAKLSARRRREIAKTAVDARNRKLSKRRRQEIARQAVRARWDARKERQHFLGLRAAEKTAPYGVGSVPVRGQNRGKVELGTGAAKHRLSKKTRSAAGRPLQRRQTK